MITEEIAKRLLRKLVADSKQVVTQAEVEGQRAEISGNVSKAGGQKWLPPQSESCFCSQGTWVLVLALPLCSGVTLDNYFSGLSFPPLCKEGIS